MTSTNLASAMPLSTPVANPNQALWEKGDFTRIADTMRASGLALINDLELVPGARVLDVGCGDGTTAIPAAQRGHEVLGVDIARNLVAAGNLRAQQAGLGNCRFVHGDASDLTGIDDASFDVAISIFGAMFAPRPFDVARELVRVVRPGGRIVMGNWIPGDPTLVAQILRISSAYTPAPPAGFVSPMTWGLKEHVLERFLAAGISAERVRCRRREWVFRYNGSPASYVALWRAWYGPIMNAFAAAESAGRTDSLQAELEELFASENQSGRDDVTEIPAVYLCVEVER